MFKHGGFGTRFYGIWGDIKSRCLNYNFITAIENTRNRRGQKIKNMEQANEIRFKYNSGYYT